MEALLVFLLLITLIELDGTSTKNVSHPVVKPTDSSAQKERALIHCPDASYPVIEGELGTPVMDQSVANDEQ